nr:hypothetical protein [uncultured Desulfobacter sp.]
MVKRIKTLLCMIVMALAVTTWTTHSPAFASDENYDTAVEESMEQYDQTIEEDGSYEERGDEEWNDQDVPETENQDESTHTN